MSASPRARRHAVGAAVLGLALVGACAPPPPPARVDWGTIRDRYLAGRAARERLATGFGASVLVWVSAGGRELPGAEGVLRLGGPAAARFTIGSVLGNAGDLAVRGDTLEGWVPSRHAAERRVASAGDAAGSAGRAAVALIAATWSPPEAAWDRALTSDSGPRVRWSADGDSLDLQVDGDGLPRVFTWRRATGDTLVVRYTSWVSVAGTLWPDRSEWSLSPGDDHARVRLEGPRAVTMTAERLRVRFPAGARIHVTTDADSTDWWHDLLGDAR